MSTSKTSTFTQPKGFTLIEILVVIAILAILAAILFPAFGRARENARRSACLSNMKQIGLGAMQYVQDYDGTFPIFHAYSSAPPEGAPIGSPNHKGIELSLQPYTKSLQIFKCPNDVGGPALADNDYGCGSVAASFRESYASCYGSSYRFTKGSFTIIENGSTSNNYFITGPTVVVKDSMFENAAQTRLMRDEMMPWFGPDADPSNLYEYGGYFQQWHPQGGTVLFADGHAKFVVSPAQFNAQFARARADSPSFVPSNAEGNRWQGD